MRSDYVKEYARLERTHWWFAVRKKIILRSIAKHFSFSENNTVLNIGAAGGASSQWLGAFGNVQSVENEPMFLQHLHNQNIPVVNAVIEQLPFADNSFDLVCAFDVVEHVQDDTTALQEMQRVCKPGGKICITVPAYKSLWGRHDVANGHKRRYDLSTLKKCLPGGNKILYTTYFNTILFLPIFIARKTDWLLFKNKEAGSDFQHFKTGGILNALCKFIFSVELMWLRFIRLPFGVSLLLLTEKSSSQKE